MTKEDINNIIQTLCPNDDDFEKPIISPAYLKTELEALALEQEPKTDVLDKIKGYIDYIRNTGMGKNKSLEFIEKFIEGLKAESEVIDADSN